jgi:hypothetical protein
MIPVYKQNGAIVGTVLAEMVGLMIQRWFARDLLKDTELFSWNTVKYFVAGSAMAVAVFFAYNHLKIFIPPIILSIGIGILVYIILLMLLREKIAMRFLLKYIKKL